MLNGLHWAFHHGIELYLTVAFIVGVSTLAADLSDRPTAPLSRAFTVGAGWPLVFLALLLYPFFALEERLSRGPELIDRRLRWFNRRVGRVKLATNELAQVIRDACPESPERLAAMRAIDAATDAASVAIREVAFPPKTGSPPPR